MFRTPQAAHASRSACMPIRFRSRQQKCKIGSISGLAQDVFGRDQRGQPGAGPGAVRDVDGADAPLAQGFGLRHRRSQIVAPRRQQFDAGNPLAAGQPGAELRFLGQRGRRLRLHARRRRDGQDPRPLQRFDGQGHLADVVGRGPAASAHRRDAQRHVTLGVAGQIFGRAEVNPPVFHFPGHAGVGLHHQRQGGQSHGPLHRAQQAVGPDAAVHAPGDRLGGAGRQRGQHPLDRLAGGRLAGARRWRRKARTALPAGGPSRPHNAPGRPGSAASRRG